MARKSRKSASATPAVSTPESIFYRAAGYLRLSSDDKKKRGDSLETQRNIIENFIATAPDIRLEGFYTDNNTTGTNFDRPGFQRMLRDAESGKITCIIVKDLTRFGRNAIDAGYYLEKYLPSLGVRFIAITDGFDSNDGDGGILLPLKNIIAESYALDISRKCRAVQRQNIREGRFVGRLAPYGYMKSPEDCHKLIIDEEAAAVVRGIFEWAIKEWSVGEITRHLNEAKILSPSRYLQTKGLRISKNHAGTEYWTQRTIRDILSDRIYLGDMVQGKTRKANHRQVLVNTDEWICVLNTHEPIISRRVFEQAQRIMQLNSARDKATRSIAVSYTPNVFNGKVFCARCGYSMHRHRQNKDGTYEFRCQSQWRYSKETCEIVAIKEAQLTTEVLVTLHKLSEVICGRLARIDAARSDLERSKEDKELKEINQALDKDGRILKSLYENMVTGMITREEFVQMKTDYEAKILALSNRADVIRNSQREAEAQIVEYRSISEVVAAAIQNDTLSAEIIERLIDKILVRPDKSFEIILIPLQKVPAQ